MKKNWKIFNFGGLHPKKLKRVDFRRKFHRVTKFLNIIGYRSPRKLFDDSIPTNYDPRNSNIALVLPYLKYFWRNPRNVVIFRQFLTIFYKKKSFPPYFQNISLAFNNQESISLLFENLLNDKMSHIYRSPTLKSRKLFMILWQKTLYFYDKLWQNLGNMV